MSSRFFIGTVKTNSRVKLTAKCLALRNSITYAHWLAFGTTLETGGGMFKRGLYKPMDL